MEQTGLSTFSPSGDGEDRPPEEAVAVAGPDSEAAGERESVTDGPFEAVASALEIGVIQVNYTVANGGSAETPIIHVFGRTEDGDAEHVRVHGFRPYFYAPTGSIDESALSDERITGYEEGYESIRGEPLTKIYGRTPRDVGNIRDEFDHYEADILFPNRFLIDLGITSGMTVPERRSDGGPIDAHYEEIAPIDLTVRPRVHMVDIEVDDRSGFPQDGEEPIICLFSHDSTRDEYVGWVFESPDAETPVPNELDDYEPLSPGADLEVRTFDTESAMLADYLRYVEETDPDCLSGWNVDDFDAPYVLDRLDRLDVVADEDLSIERLSRIDEIWRSDWQGPNIKGRIVFDLLYAYQRTQFSELDSYRLDAVGEQELGVGKERYAGDIGDLWERDPTRLLEYNLRDVELCVEIDRKQNLIDFWNEVRTFVGCKLEDATTPGDAVDMFVLHKVHGEFALPSKGQFEGEDYEGGAVFEPITGVRENVSVLDLRSLYPMCMVTINASPETKVDPTTYEGDTYRAPNGTEFRTSPDGIIRSMVDELLAEREEKKSRRNDHDPDSPDYERFDRQQAAVKVIMNCFTPDTEVLTPDGVRNIRDLSVGDVVYSIDRRTGELAVKPVTETHAYPEYRGDLIEIQTETTDFRITPNHRMLVRPRETPGNDFEFRTAGDLEPGTTYELPANWNGSPGNRVDRVDLTTFLDVEYEVLVPAPDPSESVPDAFGRVPASHSPLAIDGPGFVCDGATFDRHRESIAGTVDDWYVRLDGGYRWLPGIITGEQFFECLASYLENSEGKYAAGDGTVDSGKASSTAAGPGAAALPDGGASVPGNSDSDGVHLDGPQAADRSVGNPGFDRVFRDLLEADPDHALPPVVFGASVEQRHRFLERLSDSGRDRADGTREYVTASVDLRDELLELCVQLGYAPSYDRVDRGWAVRWTPEATPTVEMTRHGNRSTASNGVYCVTVADNHTLMAGRNGKFQFVGQSLYGVLGWDRFRLYDKEMGAAITATGREVIRFTEEQANSLGYEVVYGDTDSVMLELGADVAVNDAIDRSFEIEAAINESYDDFAETELDATEHRFEIEFEKLYRRFFQAGKKKRYAGHVVWKEGQEVDDIDITGFEYKRSDIAPITKEVQRSVIEMIVTGADIDEVNAYVREVIEDFETGAMDLDDVGIPGGIGKRLDNYDTDTAHVRGAKYANRLLGTNFNRGSKPKRLYLRKVHPAFFRRMESERELDPNTDPIYSEFKRNPDVICFEYADQIPEEFEVDWEKMLEKTLKGPIARVLEALEVSWEEVRSGQEQTGLGSFM